ncbi:hypothetical protein QJS10_CPA09g00792 [Acorus calamus]|uniref:Uncharacterized protein n=1 Tax=Acorus calamus TaxID=4465 RepID=A0AAV9EBW5_ACOCL|nr:hypothetical protein QJS10_CPA09g00792 [Acorus calamus]
MSGVLGTRSRYVRGLGHGAKLMAPSRSTRAAMEAELNRRNEENRHLRSQLEELRDEMRKSRVAMEAKIMKRTEELRIQQERQMQEMFQSLAARFQVLGCSTTPQTWCPFGIDTSRSGPVSARGPGREARRRAWSKWVLTKVTEKLRSTRRWERSMRGMTWPSAG